MSTGTVVATAGNAEVVLDAYGFYARCRAQDCTYITDYTPAKYVARRWAEAHANDQPGDGRAN
jgi:hypothetical protein